ncbi:TetR/AcrR family transcriptional regulator [Spirochaeta isovalerica]|uniref:AcrR family transcriptional regulator n=1 Tax=Spirochaeta isovalerica TaxID=150 RepID=A0A841R734_9SPIO|nr:TetR/AcrR family transcriptional regulator [Spirochaeta isovalerica]MBB6479646.1 AcrR family transcriptional regulator [Spirochaeta isovalerica]
MGKARIDENLLFEAALEEFSTYSYEEASINRIIEKAAISKGSFYYRFENKYGLYLHLLKEGAGKKWEFIRKEMERRGTAAKDDDIYSLFMIQTELGIRFAHAHPKLHRLAGMFAREKGSEIYDRALAALGGDDQSGMDDMIDKAMEKGEISNKYSRDFAKAILSFLFGSFDKIFPGSGNEGLEETLDHMEELVTFMRRGLS